MKSMVEKTHLVIILLLLCSFIVVGCDTKNDNSSKGEKNVSETSRSEVIKKLMDIDNDVTKLWNEVFCEVDWYTASGTSSTGGVLDIDFVVFNMDKFYNKVKDDKKIIDQISDEFSDIKNAFNKMFEKATIIYNEIKKETPKSNMPISYDQDISLFKQYHDYMSAAIFDLYEKEILSK